MQNLYRTTAVVTVFTAFEHFLGFLYRIILSRTLGSEGLGVYQVALTVFAVFLTVSSSGLPITLSRVISKHRANGYGKGERAATSAALILTLVVSLSFTLLLFLFRPYFSRIFTDPRSADLFYIFILGLSFSSVYAILRGCFWGNRRFFAYSFIELAEELIMIGVGVIFIVCIRNTDVPDVNKAAIAVLVSYLCSFAIAVVYFFKKGGRLASPKGELLPMFKSAMPVTAMRASSSLMNSLISVLFPMRLMAAGVSSAVAMSEFGVVYGMVVPILMVPSTLISSLALVLVPEISECYYKKQHEKLSALLSKALNTSLLVAFALIPFFLVCGENVGIFLFSNVESGKMLSYSAFMLIPMSITMISTSLLNSMNCEKQTLLFFLFGSAFMLLSVLILPKYLGSGALILGMFGDFTIAAVCSLLLLRKKAGKLQSGKYLLKLSLCSLAATLFGLGVRFLLMRCMGYVAASSITLFAIAAAEIALLQALKLFDFKKIFARFFIKKRKKAPART